MFVLLDIERDSEGYLVLKKTRKKKKVSCNVNPSIYSLPYSNVFYLYNRDAGNYLDHDPKPEGKCYLS